jgi:hypothetical protein
MNILKEGLRLARTAAAGSGYDGVTPPQPGYTLDKCSDILSTSDHVCRSER